MKESIPLQQEDDMANCNYASRSFLPEEMGCIRDGMKFLDMYVPQWRTLVDIARLDMQSDTDSIIGQVFGSYQSNRAWLFSRCSHPALLGFTTLPSERDAKHFDELTRIWKKHLSKVPQVPDVPIIPFELLFEDRLARDEGAQRILVPA